MPYAAIIFDNDYLEHHGVKGQKWGRRRYQNYDGTYKNAKNRPSTYSQIRASKDVTRKKVASGIAGAASIGAAFTAGRNVGKSFTNTIAAASIKKLGEKSGKLARGKANIDANILLGTAKKQMVFAGISALAAIGLGAAAIHKHKQAKRMDAENRKHYN